VVATPVGGTAEVVKDGTTGLLIEPGNPSELAEAVCRLLDQPEQAMAMGRNGRVLVEQAYDWDTVAEQTLAVYHDVVGSRDAGRRVRGPRNPAATQPGQEPKEW
jgi:glycosyltransferase involved in cell wall biosynthesis